MKNILITGGAGFAGSHIVDRVCNHYPNARIRVLDKMTYAGDVRNISEHLLSNRIQLQVGDVANLETCERAVAGTDLVIHAAAESHVDNSFGNSLEFTRTNILGTHALMEACRKETVPRIIHISTDEVYGEVIHGAADEQDTLKPTNPYSSSKAAAEMIVRGYVQSFQLPIITVRANNLYGTRQFPEKIIPRFICHLLKDRKLPLHGTGTNRRHYLSTADFSDAILFIAERGSPGETYNIGTQEEYSNLQVASLIAKHFGVDSKDVIEHVGDRPFNDARYSISRDKLRNMGWQPMRSLADDIDLLVRWYRENIDRYEEFLCPPQRL